MTDVLHIFVGPTLKPEDRALCPGALFHPPVAQGDVYQLVEDRPLAIGIIDGYFERVPAVWHKEILWALSQGVHVFGSASMGALRAAELAPFGMIGVGEIFSDFAAGRLEDDDEVTLVHADEAHGYRLGSEPMVNIRATLNAAVKKGIISRSAADRLVHYTKRLYYPERNYDAMLCWAQESKLPSAEIRLLREWLSNTDNRVDRKRQDGRRMLEEMRAFREKNPGPKSVTWTFQNTDAWAQVKRTMSTHVELKDNSMPTTFNAVVDELRLNPTEYAEVKREAMQRLLGIRLAAEKNERPSDSQIEAAAIEFRRKNGLFDSQSTEQWLRQQCVTDTEFELLMKDQAALERTTRIFSGCLDAMIRDVLKMRSRYGELKRRADRKQAMEMSGRYSVNAFMVETGDLTELIQWFFKTHLAQDIPRHLDVFLGRLDISSKDVFFSMLRREYVYQQLFPKAVTDTSQPGESDAV